MVTVALIFKIASLAIVVGIINKVLDGLGRGEYNIFVNLLGVIIALLMVIDVITKFFKTVKTMFQL